MEELNSIFAQLNVPPEILLVVGLILALIGIYKILSNGLTLAFWVLLLVVGVSSISYALRTQGVVIPPALSATIEPGKDMSIDALRALCEKVDGLQKEEEKKSKFNPLSWFEKL